MPHSAALGKQETAREGVRASVQSMGWGRPPEGSPLEARSTPKML